MKKLKSIVLPYGLYYIQMEDSGGDGWTIGLRKKSGAFFYDCSDEVQRQKSMLRPCSTGFKERTQTQRQCCSKWHPSLGIELLTEELSTITDPDLILKNIIIKTEKVSGEHYFATGDLIPYLFIITVLNPIMVDSGWRGRYWFDLDAIMLQHE